MSQLLKRSTESSGSEWLELEPGQYRFVVGQPKLAKSQKFGNFMVQFPLTLTEDERKRYETEHGTPGDGRMQSYRPAFGGYSTGLSLGYIQRDGTYKSTRLVDFLCCLYGVKNQRDVRNYFAQGGGFSTDKDAPEEEQVAAVDSWLEWFEGLEVIGSIRHDAGNDGGILARFGGPLPVGSERGFPDPDYQNFGRGKLRAMLASEGGNAEVSPAEKGVAEGAAVAAKYGPDGELLEEEKPARSYGELFPKSADAEPPVRDEGVPF